MRTSSEEGILGRVRPIGPRLSILGMGEEESKRERNKITNLIGVRGV